MTGMGRRPTTGYATEEIPDSMPLQNQGAIPVIARLVDSEHGEHFRPAEVRLGPKRTSWQVRAGSGVSVLGGAEHVRRR